jgi:hypothetical protein
VILFVVQSSPDNSALMAAALGSTIGMTVGLVASGIAVWQKFGAYLSWRTALRVVIAAGVAVTAGRLLPDLGKLFTLVACALVLLLYFAVLVGIGEFKREDLRQLKRIFRRKKPE